MAYILIYIDVLLLSLCLPLLCLPMTIASDDSTLMFVYLFVNSLEVVLCLVKDEDGSVGVFDHGQLPHLMPPFAHLHLSVFECEPNEWMNE